MEVVHQFWASDLGSSTKYAKIAFQKPRLNGRQVNQAKKRTSKKFQTPKLAQNGMFILRS